MRRTPQKKLGKLVDVLLGIIGRGGNPMKGHDSVVAIWSEGAWDVYKTNAEMLISLAPLAPRNCTDSVRLSDGDCFRCARCYRIKGQLDAEFRRIAKERLPT